MLRHIPVLAQEIYDQLPPNWQQGFDGTFGHGGHAEYFLSHEAEKRPIETLKIIGTDVDPLMIAKAKELTKNYAQQISILHSSYAEVANIAAEKGAFDYLLLDLGVNLEHFKDGSR